MLRTAGPARRQERRQKAVGLRNRAGSVGQRHSSDRAALVDVRLGWVFSDECPFTNAPIEAEPVNIAFFEQFLSSLAILDFPEQEVALRKMMFPFIAVPQTFVTPPPAPPHTSSAS